MTPSGDEIGWQGSHKKLIRMVMIANNYID